MPVRDVVDWPYSVCVCGGGGALSVCVCVHVPVCVGGGRQVCV